MLGFTETFRTPRAGIPSHVELRLDGFMIGLGTVEAARDVHGVEAAPGSPAMVIVLWTDDVDTAHRDLLAAGVPVVRQPHDTGNNNRNCPAARSGTAISWRSSLSAPERVRQTSHMRAVDLVVLVGWLAFWIYWLVAAANMKAGTTRWGQFAGFRVGIVLVVLLLLRLGVLKGHAGVTNPWLWGIGLALFAAGLALAVWARLYIGRNWGVPMSRKDEPELVTTGPYRTIRHPIYSGLILGMIGTALAVSWYWVIAVALMGAYFIYSAVHEERYMTEQFPAAYPDYKRSTKMLVPFIL